MFQKLVAIGRLGTDVESRATAGGSTVTRFPMAVNSGYGEKKQTEWLKVVAFGKLAEICNEHLRKSSMVMVEGRIATREWEDKQSQKRYTTEVIAEKVVFLDKNTDAQVEPF